MKTLNLTPGSADWHAHRNRPNARNASEASAVMGCSPYVTRAELIRRKATGITPDVDAATQGRFDDGHRAEELARPHAEALAGCDLYAVTGLSDADERLSASFDGLSMDETIVWENKLTNAGKAADLADGHLPEADYWQCCQQALISRCERLLYTLADRDGNITAHLWVDGADLVASAPELLAAWDQLDADVAAHVPEPVKAAVVAAPVAGFGALTLRVEGRVLASNLDAFTAGAQAFIARLPDAQMLQTDQDFANAEAAVKACAEAESRIKSEREAVLAQMSDVDAVLRATEAISETIRAARLSLDKAVKAEKENRRLQIIQSGAEKVRLHAALVNESLPVDHHVNPPLGLLAELGAAIKGLKSLDSMADKVAGAVAAAKIALTTEGDRHRANVAILAQANRPALFADARTLVATKQPDDLRNLVAARIAAADKAEADRIEAERAKIRAEEEARAQREAERLAEQERERIREEERQRLQISADLQNRIEAAADRVAAVVEQVAANESQAGAGPAPVEAPAAAETNQREQAPVAAVRPGATLKLGEINARIAPLTITGDGLAALGFKPVGMDKAAKLFDAAQFPDMCRAMGRVLKAAMEAPALKEAA